MLNERKLIMLVDDDSVCNSINSIILKRRMAKEFELVAFQSPVEALKYLSYCFEISLFRKILILLDINMPVMSGWELLEEYSAIPNHETEVVIFILSSSIYKGDIERVNENPIVAEFISKPITPYAIDKLLKKME